jgi:hypothetical protein
MSNLSDKELDRLSREAADSYEPDHSSLSWNRLEQKLTRDMPEGPPDGFRFGRIHPYIWGPAVILLAGVSFFLIKNFIYSQDSTRNNQTATQPVSSATTAASPDADKQAGSGNTVHLDSVTSVSPGPLVSESLHAGTISGAGTNNTVNGASKNLIPNAKKAFFRGSVLTAGAIRSGGTQTKNGLNDVEKDGLVQADGATTGSTGTTGISPGSASSQREKNQLSLPVIITTASGPGNVSGNDSLLNQLAQSKTPIHQKSLHVNRSLNFGLVFGPDYTDAGGIANNQIGNNIGLTIGYYLTNKLSVNTGIIYSNKFYWSKAHNFPFQQPANIQPTAYPRTYAAPPPIDFVNGAGNIWEIPLTLRYDFAHKVKTKFFLNAGLSSYFMMKQTYIYFFHSGQNPLAFKVTNNSQENYWFGIADISAGFEAEIGKGFSFQAEPFLKLPIKNMGMENLKLTSYGFLLSFRYSPVLNRTKK